MLTWSDIRAIDSIADPLGVVSVYVDRPDHATGRLVRAVALAGELRRLEQDVATDGRGELAAAYRDCLPRIRPALARMLDGGDARAGAVRAALDRGGVRDRRRPARGRDRRARARRPTCARSWPPSTRAARRA